MPGRTEPSDGRTDEPPFDWRCPTRVDRNDRSFALCPYRPRAPEHRIKGPVEAPSRAILGRCPAAPDPAARRPCLVPVNPHKKELVLYAAEHRDDVGEPPPGDNANRGVRPAAEASEGAARRDRDARRIWSRRDRRKRAVEVENRYQTTAPSLPGNAVRERSGRHGCTPGTGASARRAASPKSLRAHSKTFRSNTRACIRSMRRRRSSSVISSAVRIARAVPAAS